MSSAAGARRALRGPAVLGTAALAVAWTATLALDPWADESVGDLGVRSGFAERILGGALPYREFPFEYPPLAAPVVALPGLAGTEVADYRLGIAALTFLLALAVMLLAGALAHRTGASAGAAMVAVAAAPLLLGAVIRLHFDLFPVALVLAALVAILDRRPGLGLALAGLGAMTKGFPVVVAPVALAWLWTSGDRRGALRGAAAFGATLALVGAVWIAASPQGALESLRYQLDRPVQVESAPASVLWGAGALVGEKPEVVHSHASAGLDHPLDGPVSLGFGIGLAVVVAGLSVLAARVATRRRDASGADRAVHPKPPGRAIGDGPFRSCPGVDALAARALVLAALAAVVAFSALGRVLSPQYLTWAVPLLAMAVAWRRMALAAVTAAACLLTLAEFPSRYLDLVDGEPVAVAIVALRNAALLGTVAIAAALLVREARLRGAPVADDRGVRTVTAVASRADRSIAPARTGPPR